MDLSVVTFNQSNVGVIGPALDPFWLVFAPLIGGWFNRYFCCVLSARFHSTRWANDTVFRYSIALFNLFKLLNCSGNAEKWNQSKRIKLNVTFQTDKLMAGELEPMKQIKLSHSGVFGKQLKATGAVIPNSRQIQMDVTMLTIHHWRRLGREKDTWKWRRFVWFINLPLRAWILLRQKRETDKPVITCFYWTGS